ncbi:hypothetical protein F5Y05DRAFT_204602 [Hypoxylon sp. FL0543]|nr:hypothetical protein F5Y05DRAFT_204602 [Hypoxylon sp. FL0543]
MMDSSTGHQARNTTKDSIVAKYKSDLALQEELLEKEEQDLRSTNECNLQKLKAILPSALYRDTVLPMAEKSLKHDLQELDTSHRRRLKFIEKSHMEELARHEVDRHSSHMEELARQEKLKVDTPVNEQQPSAMSDILPGLPGATGTRDTVISQAQVSRKRKVSVSKEPPPKRLRLDTSVNGLRTPATTPNESAHPPERTITFDEVYQGGNAKFKDTIVEWPRGSRKWYILKCEKHGLHFTKNAIQGAAKHLNGLSHGFPDRNREVAVNTLGYLVVDCDESLARLNNSVAEEAYDKGYKPRSAKSKNRSSKGLEGQKDEKGLVRAFPSNPANLVPGSAKGIAPTPEKQVVEGGTESQSGTPSTHQKSPASWSGITHPKTFHIYYGHWKVNVHRKGSDKIYPVMILGWDRQNGSGLKDTELNDTGLLKKANQPPNCYIYDSNKIVGWAPGFEDGGPKIRLRKFPVMFFDASQTVAWLAARDLAKFPLYQREAPEQPDHPFNAARRWIAEREGYQTWEDRERARISNVMARAPSPSPITPIEGVSNVVSRAGEGEGPSATTKSDLPDHSDDSESSGSELETTSVVTADTERLMEDMRDKAGEITGDDDYSLSDSEVDETLECEMEAWERSTLSDARPGDSAANRPWAFYGLRSAEKAKEPKLPAIQADGTQESSLVAGDSRGSLRTAAESGGDVPSATRGPSQSHRRRSADESLVGEAPFEHDELVAKIKRTLGFFAQDDLARTATGSQRPTSRQSEPGTRHAAVIQPTSEDRAASILRARMSGVTQRVEELEDDDEGPVTHDKQALAKDERAAAQKENGQWRGPKGYTDDAVEKSWPEGGMVLPPTTSRTSGNVPTPIISSVDGSADDEITPTITPTRADFELSLYSNGDVSWERSDEQGGCIQLFHTADRKVIVSRREPVKVVINPMEISGFSREELEGSEKMLFILKIKDGSSSRLVFDRSEGSKLGNGKVQARGFIKWLRDVNPFIDCLDA